MVEGPCLAPPAPGGTGILTARAPLRYGRLVGELQGVKERHGLARCGRLLAPHLANSVLKLALPAQHPAASEYHKSRVLRSL